MYQINKEDKSMAEKIQKKGELTNNYSEPNDNTAQGRRTFIKRIASILATTFAGTVPFKVGAQQDDKKRENLEKVKLNEKEKKVIGKQSYKNIKARTDEFLDHTQVSKSMMIRTKREPKLAKLLKHAEKRGYKRATGEKDFMGLKTTIKAKQPVKAPQGFKGTVEEVNFEFNLQNLTKKGAKDQLAIAIVEIKAGEWSEIYSMLLEAPDGDFKKHREFFVKDNRILKANSWYDRTLNCMFNKCIGPCLEAFINCIGLTWALYLWCVAIECGTCFAECAACAVCNCRWWCRWGVGCCE